MSDKNKGHKGAPKLRALGASANNNPHGYRFPEPDPELIETFECPDSASASSVELIVAAEAPEFTCLCPLTGQPDFGEIRVLYVPRDVCLESKSWKLYLGSFRNWGSFHEQVISDIFDALWGKLHPRRLAVHGKFAPRGGISFCPTVNRPADDAVPSEVWNTAIANLLR